MVHAYIEEVDYLRLNSASSCGSTGTSMKDDLAPRLEKSQAHSGLEQIISESLAL